MSIIVKKTELKTTGITTKWNRQSWNLRQTPSSAVLLVPFAGNREQIKDLLTNGKALDNKTSFSMC